MPARTAWGAVENTWVSLLMVRRQNLSESRSRLGPLGAEQEDICQFPAMQGVKVSGRRADSNGVRSVALEQFPAAKTPKEGECD